MQLPQGFRFSGEACGIKKSGKTDLTLIVSDRPAVASGVYTTNQVVAAPVVYCRQHSPSNLVRAIVVNSGNANACTGDQGMRDTQEMALATSKVLGFNDAITLVMSTGVIGHPMPMAKVHQGINAASETLGATESDFIRAVNGIMTTDAFRKFVIRAVKLGDATYSIAGMAKGAGMIGPKMATMLGVFCTDAPLTETQCDVALKRAVGQSFNCISVEGHMSTNDSVVLISNGLSESQSELSDEQFEQFCSVLDDACIDLAKLIPQDGEGAKHRIEIRIEGAESNQDADQIARTIANSNLVKTAITGNDPNWGRICSAAGYAGVPIDAKKLSLVLNGSQLFQNGEPLAFDAKHVSESLAQEFDTIIELGVGSGPGTATHWTSDLTTAYVTFNSDYTT